VYLNAEKRQVLPAVGLGLLDEQGLGRRASQQPLAVASWMPETLALVGLLPKFLAETETAAVIQSREAMKENIAAAIASAVEAINRGSE